MGHIHGVDSETGRLRTVLAHRPGAELLRLTPRTKDRLLFPGLPWVARAQQEHDIAAECLRDRGVEVLYVMELLQDVMEYPSARAVPPEQRLWSSAAGTGKVRHVELRVSSRSQGDHIVLALAGEIDLYTAPRLQSELTSVLSANKSAQIVVDMSAVEFCDSTGMNVLLAAHRVATERGGDLTLAAPRPPVRKILEVTGLQSVFTVDDDLPAVAGQ